MYRNIFAAALGLAAGQSARVFVVLLTSVLGGTVVRAQKQNFATPSPNFTNTVSVRELQVSDKAKEKFERGLKSLEKNDPEAGLKRFKEAIEASPSYYEAYYHKGIAEAEMGRNHDALQSFGAATELSEGRYPRAEFGYGLVLAREGRAAEAETVVRHGLQTAPNIADGHVVLGVVLLELHKVDEAEQSGREALRLKEPESAKGHLILADVYSMRGDFAGQSRELKAYLDANPKDKHRDMLKASLNAAKRLAKRVQDRKGQTEQQVSAK